MIVRDRVLFALFAVAWGLACAPPLDAADPVAAKAVPTTDGNDLFQHWVRSNEEEPPGETVEIFRPAGSIAFPPSRFRMAYTFAPGGRCEAYVLSPDDNHHFEACAWSLDGSDRTLLEIVSKGTTTRYEVVGLSEKLLRLKPLKQGPP